MLRFRGKHQTRIYYCSGQKSKMSYQGRNRARKGGFLEKQLSEREELGGGEGAGKGVCPSRHASGHLDQHSGVGRLPRECRGLLLAFPLPTQ